MADPIAQLQNYWIKVAADDAELGDLATAQVAMKNAIIAARYMPAERQRFAQASIFTEALSKDPESASVVALAVKTKSWGADIDTQPVRLIMLNFIREIATGTSWTTVYLPGGVTPWLGSASASAPVFYKTLTDDPSDTVLAAAIKFLSEVPLPKAWGEYILRHDPNADAIVARIVRSRGTAQEREALLSAARSAIGQMTVSLGQQLQQEVVEASGTVETSGTGEPTETMPPAKPVAWYRTRKAGLALVGALAALAGASYRLRRRS